MSATITINLLIGPRWAKLEALGHRTKFGLVSVSSDIPGLIALVEYDQLGNPTGEECAFGPQAIYCITFYSDREKALANHPFRQPPVFSMGAGSFDGWNSGDECEEEYDVEDEEVF